MPKPDDPFDQHLREVDAFIAFCLGVPAFFILVALAKAFLHA